MSKKQKKYEAVFGKAKQMGYSEDRAKRIAVQAANKVQEPVHMLKGAITDVARYKAKSSLSEAESYYAEFVFGDTQEDSDGDSVPTNTLLRQMAGLRGDMEHARLYDHQYKQEYGENPFHPEHDLFEVVDSFFSDTKLMGKVKFNVEHPLFENVWEHIRNGEYGMSLEYRQEGDDWVIEGLSAAKDPKNQRSKLVSAYQVKEDERRVD